jgi:hypothetical protein
MLSASRSEHRHLTPTRLRRRLAPILRHNLTRPLHHHALLPRAHQSERGAGRSLLGIRRDAGSSTLIALGNDGRRWTRSITPYHSRQQPRHRACLLCRWWSSYKAKAAWTSGLTNRFRRCVGAVGIICMTPSAPPSHNTRGATAWAARWSDPLLGYSGLVRMLFHAGELSFLGALGGGIGGGVAGTLGGLATGALAGGVIGAVLYRVRGLGTVLGLTVGVVAGAIGGSIGGTVGHLGG